MISVRAMFTSLSCLAAMCLLSAAAHAADTPADRASAPLLHLVDGGYVSGRLKDSSRPNILRWQSPAFMAPFDFPAGTVSSVHFPSAGARPKPKGEYCFELAGGDLLYGSLVALSAGEAELEVPQFGSVRLRRDILHRITRWNDGASLLYLGPNGLSGWHETLAKKQWREEAGHIVTDKDGSVLHRDFDLPGQASIEFEISWTSTPDFVLAIGTPAWKKGADLAQDIARAFRFEVWDRDLVVVRESAHDADLASLAKIKPGPGRIHLQAHLDQQRSRLLVVSVDGKLLADLRLPIGDKHPLPGIRLLNKRGNVRLERLRISRWNGINPPEVQADKPRIHRSGGSIIYGQIQGFDPSTNQFLVRGEKAETRIDSKDVETVVFSNSDTSAARTVRAILLDGVRLSGQLTKVDQGSLWLACPGVTETLPVPVSKLHTLLVLDRKKPPAFSAGRIGHLDLDGVKLKGSLVDGQEKTEASCLVWQPSGSISASPLRHGISGTIVYRDPPPSRKTITTPVPRVRVSRHVGLMGAFLQTLAANPANGKPAKPSIRSLHLRTGDTISCEVTRIDEQGVHFKTKLSDATFVPHEKVKALELAHGVRTINVNNTKRNRLLTLPRMQKHNPPTHLIRSISGDYLRGRITEMDDKKLSVEVRLENKQLPRQYVSQIIWLHEDELDPSEPSPSSQSAPTTRVQALRSNGIRLTFFPKRLAAGILSGRSDVLGACRIDIKQVDQLSIGNAIEQAAAKLVYHRWKLHNAVEPKFASADNGQGAPAPGTESALVGRPAPDFQLALLSGKQFRLSDHKGQIIVLDFWASWCGPCIQAMPQVDTVVHQFQHQNVQLISVNLQESPDKITATLQRLDLKMAVALDQDGAVAAKYGATAIPQTVVIGRDGNVARLFVGGGSRLGDQLRDSLADLLADKNPTQPAN